MWKGTSLCVVGAGVSRFGALARCGLVAFCILLSLRMKATDISMSYTDLPLSDASGNTVVRGSDSDNQGSMILLSRLASEQILTDHDFLGRTRFRVDQQGRTVFCDLKPVPTNFVLSEGDPYASALEALIREDSLRRDFRAAIPDEKFWVLPLDSIEQTVQRCVRDAESSRFRQSAAGNQQECTNNIRQQFDKLRTLIATYASEHNFKLVEPPETRDPTPGYRVHVKIDPAKARVRVMTLLEYKKYQYFKTPKEQYQWNDLLDSENDMIGWYHYRAEWPPELNGAEEGDFDIEKPGTITFKPPQK